MDGVMEAANTLLAFANENGAAQISLVFSDKQDKPLKGVFVVDEPELTKQIKQLIDDRERLNGN